MPRVAPIQSTFNAGELSPNLAGRTDFDKYKAGCYQLENAIPLVQGPVEMRPGFMAVAQTKSADTHTWLVPFHFNQTQSYVIEMGDRYVRFYYQRGQLLLSPGVPVELDSPYSSNDLINADGTLKPTFVQSNDVMYWAHPNYYPHILKRFGHTVWDFSLFAFGIGAYTPYQLSFQGPMDSYNPDRTDRIYASAVSGIVTLTAGGVSGPIFQDWMLGRYMILEQNNRGVDDAPWEPAKVVAIGDVRRVDGRHYRANTAGTTGTVRPVHTQGTKSDGGVDWVFAHPGFGTVLVTAIADPSHATATVLMELPGNVVGAANATPLFAFEAWNSNAGYPSLVFFFRERLGFARGNQIWLSSPGDFLNFADRDLNNEVTDDQAIIVTLSSDTADPIRWACETPQGLLVGTDGGEWLIGEPDQSAPLSPSNIRASRQSAYGSRQMRPVPIQHAVLYVQRGGRKLREAVWSIETESIKSRDLTVLADHITQSGITSLAFQQEPRQTLWATRQDGLLVSFTYNVEQDVYGWHRHPLGGGAHAESVCSIPSPDGQSDDLWVITTQTIAGKSFRCVQLMDEGYKDGGDYTKPIYLDTALVWQGSIPLRGMDSTTNPILEQWVGENVYMVVDGQPVGAFAVFKIGSFPAQVLCDTVGTRIVVGFPYRAVIGTMRRDEGAADGTAQGKTKRVHDIWLRFRNTMAAKVGPSLDKLEPVQFRSGFDGMSTALPPYTGDKHVPYPGDYETAGRIFVVQDLPLPMTLIAIMPRMATND